MLRYNFIKTLFFLIFSLMIHAAESRKQAKITVGEVKKLKRKSNQSNIETSSNVTE